MPLQPHHILFKIQTGLTFLVPAYPGCPRKEAVKRVSVGQSSVCDVTDNTLCSRMLFGWPVLFSLVYLGPRSFGLLTTAVGAGRCTAWIAGE